MKNDDDFIDKVYNNLIEIKVLLAKHSEILQKQEENLQEHIRRTNILESKVEKIERKSHFVEASFKLIGVLGFLLGVLANIVKLFK